MEYGLFMIPILFISHYFRNEEDTNEKHHIPTKTDSIIVKNRQSSMIISDNPSRARVAIATL